MNLKNMLRFDEENSQVFYLKPNDIVYVPKTWIKSAAEVARDVSAITFFRGWNLGFSWELHSTTDEEGSGIEIDFD